MTPRNALSSRQHRRADARAWVRACRKFGIPSAVDTRHSAKELGWPRSASVTFWAVDARHSAKELDRELGRIFEAESARALTATTEAAAQRECESTDSPRPMFTEAEAASAEALSHTA